MVFYKGKLSSRRKVGFMNSNNYSRADYYRMRKSIMDKYEEDEDFQGFSRTSKEKEPEKKSVFKSIFCKKKK